MALGLELCGVERDTRVRVPQSPPRPDDLSEKNGHHPTVDIETICASVVKPEKVRWLWEKRIPFGKLTIFDGDPDVGKSVVTIDIAARVSTGRGFPDGARCEDPMNVAIANVEDGVADTIVPRLMAAGADLERVQIIQGLRDGKGGRRLLDIPGDVGALEKFVEEHDIKLLIIDPVLTMLGGDANKDQDARKALAPLRDMAEQTGCAVIAVRHLNKSVGLKAIQRGGGNMGLIGVARAGSFFAKDPEDDGRRVMALHKSNLVEKPPSLVYRIVSSAVYETARVEWLGVSAHDAYTLSVSPASPHEKSVLEEAKDFLREELRDGSAWAKQVYKDARDAGIAEITLRRAKTALGVKSARESTDGWSWSLPPKGDHALDPDQDDHVDQDDHHQNPHCEDSPYVREDDHDDQGDRGVQGDYVGDHLPTSNGSLWEQRQRDVEKCHHNVIDGCYLCHEQGRWPPKRSNHIQGRGAM